MSADQLLGGLAGALLGLGLVAALAGVIGMPDTPRRVQRARRRLPTGWARWRWPVAAVAAVTVWALSSWPVAGLIAAAVVLGLPPLLTTGRAAGRAIERVEAMEEWTRRLGDVLTVGVGLEQAIVSSTRTAPAAISGEVQALAARLTARVPTEVALRRFADDLADPTGDLIVAALLLGHRRRGPGVARTLTAAADSVASEVASRRRIEAERAKPRTTARAVTVITLAVAGLGMLNQTYVAPYGTPLGQLVLFGVASVFVGSLWWMRSLTLSGPQPRLVTRHDGGR